MLSPLTIGRGSFGALNIALLFGCGPRRGLFCVPKRAPRVALDPIGDVPRSRAEREPRMSALVSTVLMATLVVGPFYLAGALGLDRRWSVRLVGRSACGGADRRAGRRMADRFGAGA